MPTITGDSPQRIARVHAGAGPEQGNEDVLAAVLGEMVQQRDPYTARHMSRVEWLSVKIALKLGLDRHRLNGLRLGARLHDLGKFSIPAEILNKPGRLSPQELELVRQHPRKGYDIVSRFRWSAPVAEIILQHHERLDGKGYPLGLAGREILLEARILTVGDVVEAMISHRPYRPALPKSVAIDEIRQGRGARYDPEAVDACLELLCEGAPDLPVEIPDLDQTSDRS
jgi:HD-GYP domain-containing protein (c-di-GMP phosphodiesterase class II)